MLFGEHNLLPLVEMVPKSGGAMAPPAPPRMTPLSNCNACWICWERRKSCAFHNWLGRCVPTTKKLLEMGGGSSINDFIQYYWPFPYRLTTFLLICVKKNSSFMTPPPLKDVDIFYDDPPGFRAHLMWVSNRIRKGMSSKSSDILRRPQCLKKSPT